MTTAPKNPQPPGTEQGAGADTHRWVTLDCPAPGVFVARNVRGGELRITGSDDVAFTPVELLLAAIGACSAVDVDAVTRRRSEPETFAVRVDAQKDRDAVGNLLRDIEVTFSIAFPAGEAGDAAREALPRAVQASHDRTCTVSRTVELGTSVRVRIA